MSKGKETQQIHKKGSVRHAEKRRIATCLFADRIARESIEAYNQCVPEEWRNENKQICLATFVAHFRPMSVQVSVPKDGADANTNNEDGDGDGDGSPCGHLQVMGLGVGTKYLSEDLIRDEQESGTGYGMRIRDLHAEVLARRAFRHKLSLEMRSLLFQREHNERAENDVNADAADADAATKQTYRPILQFVPSENGDGDDFDGTHGGKFALVDGVTIHMYTSSTPCGNSSLKKFAKMAKEKYDASLGRDEWFMQPHSKNPAAAHSLHLGSFALLVKKDFSVQIKDVNSEQCDNNVDDNNDNDNDDNDNSDTAAPRCKITKFMNGYDMMSHIPRKQRMWPANQNDDWCPSGTSLPHLGKGSIHTCSDKICRWNCLGVQGSLLSSLLDTPIYITSMTVGRKFTRSIAQRALCCRAVEPIKKQSKRKRGGGDVGVGVDKDANVNAGRERDGVKGHDGNCNDCNQSSDFRLNHPSIMGTAVYLDDSGEYCERI